LGSSGLLWYSESFSLHREEPFLAEQNLNGRLFLIVDELVRRGVTLEQARREFEKQFIVASLKSNRGNFCRSAKSLGVHRNTLRNKVSDLGIIVEDYELPGRRPPRRKVAPPSES
jgi:DNA-binding NtrC family response regulator